jgi:hypothetical protein
MSQYACEDIVIYNASYLHSRCITEARYNILVQYLLDHSIVNEYLHFLTTNQFPLEVSFDESSEDYLQDTYNV